MLLLSVPTVLYSKYRPDSTSVIFVKGYSLIDRHEHSLANNYIVWGVPFIFENVGIVTINLLIYPNNSMFFFTNMESESFARFV